MAEPVHRLLQIFNRTIGGGGEDLAVSLIGNILRREAVCEDVMFDSAEWKGMDAPPLWKQAALTFHNPQSIARIRSAQSRVQAGAWILHNYIPIVSGGVFGEALSQRIPIIQYIHNFRPFSVSSYLWAGKNLDPARWRRNFLREICYGTWQNSRARTAFLALFLAWLHTTGRFRAIAAWVAISDFMRDKFIAAGIPASSVFRLYHPWTLQNESVDFEEDDYFLFLGRLTEEKGIKVLLQAWEVVTIKLGTQAPRLVVAGDGPLRALVEKAASNGRNVQFRGFVTGEEKKTLLARCRAVIQPAISGEALSLVIYEAYDFAKPVLAAGSGGMTELVQHGSTGLRHQPANPNDLAETVITANSSARVRKTMGARGRDWLIANTDEKVWRQDFFKIIDFSMSRRTGSERR